ncbi:MAG TPA: glutathione S-transferase family protein [Chromatiaceae bacterium]|jgi:glutathione S-transferase|nr:glutathione S-transferase family protein [Chromatiaceae bacterium]
MKLYYAPGTCALAVHVALIWAGDDYQVEQVVLGSDAYKKINPMGAVPALVDGDSGVMLQADSLLKYISNKYPDAAMGGPEGLLGEQQIDQWLAFLGGDLHPAFWPIFRPARITTREDQESIDAVQTAANNRLHSVFGILDQHLAGRDYIVGEQRSIVDVYAYVMTRWMARTRLILADFPDLLRHFERTGNDAGVIQAENEQGLR